MRVVRTSYDDPDTLQAWQALLAESKFDVGSWFRHPEWHMLWWKHYGNPLPHAELLLLRLEDTDTIFAIAPLVVYSRYASKAVLWQTIRFSGFELTPYTDIISEQRNQERAWNGIMRFITEHYPHAWLELSDVLPDGSLHSYVPSRQMKIQTTPADDYLHVDTFQEHLKKEFTPTGLSRSMKIWKADPAYSWQFREGYDENVTGSLIEYNRNTFGSQSYFHVEQNRHFFRDICRTMSQEIWYSVLSHTAQLSILMGFRQNGILYHFMSGTPRNHADSNLRAGYLNTYFLLQHMQQNEFTRFDMLRGKEEYKFTFGPEVVHSKRVTLIPGPARARYSVARMFQGIKKVVAS